MRFTPDRIPCRVQGAESSGLGRELVILDPAGRMLRALNASGARIWELVDGQRTVQQIADALAAELRAEPDRVLRDTVALIEALAARELIVAMQEGST